MSNYVQLQLQLHASSPDAEAKSDIIQIKIALKLLLRRLQLIFFLTPESISSIINNKTFALEQNSDTHVQIRMFETEALQKKSS